MLINGCLANNDASIDENTLTEIFAELDIEDEIENEALAVVGGDFEVYSVDGDDDEFTIVSTEAEYRCIHEDKIDQIFRDEGYDVYDEDHWRQEVASENTEEGYDDWFESIINDAEYGSFFGSYDGREESCGDYYMFRVN